MCELNFAFTHQEMFIRGTNINGTPQDGFAVLGFFDGKGRPAAEQVWNLTLVPGIKMLHDENSSAARFDRTHDLHKRSQATGRCANGDEFTLNSRRRITLSFGRNHDTPASRILVLRGKARKADWHVARPYRGFRRCFWTALISSWDSAVIFLLASMVARADSAVWEQR